MRIFFALAIFTADLMILPTAMAQGETWHYLEETDPFTDEIAAVKAVAVAGENSGLMVRCKNNELVLVAGFEHADEERKPHAHVKWRENNGKAIEFKPEVSMGKYYVVRSPRSIVLSRRPIKARQFATSNGADGILQFNDLYGGATIKRVLKACGH